ncbi:MAG: hypothetical protein M5U34_04085 [Chloroflexi bacterium]|nr:hypothetical protein [Chloroflexota bacterium]
MSEYVADQPSIVPSDEDIIYGDFIILASADKQPVFSQNVPWIEVDEGNPNSPLRGETISFDTVGGISPTMPIPYLRSAIDPRGNDIS